MKARTSALRQERKKGGGNVGGGGIGTRRDMVRAEAEGSRAPAGARCVWIRGPEVPCTALRFRSPPAYFLDASGMRVEGGRCCHGEANRYGKDRYDYVAWEMGHGRYDSVLSVTVQHFDAK